MPKIQINAILPKTPKVAIDAIGDTFMSCLTVIYAQLADEGLGDGHPPTLSFSVKRKGAGKMKGEAKRPSRRDYQQVLARLIHVIDPWNKADLGEYVAAITAAKRILKIDT